jgi:hypothetical protein
MRERNTNENEIRNKTMVIIEEGRNLINTR